jgi:hypothetical protein
MSEPKFEEPDVPFKVGQLRTRVWAAPYTNGLTDIWRRRCEEYWERIEKRFGVVMSDRKYDWAVDDALGPVVATYATPLYIVPGERFKLPKGERITQ